MSPPSLNGTERAPRFLRDALAILRAVNAENATGDVGAPLAQVLLNYQGGGWRRHVLEQVSMTHQDAMGDSQPYASTNELHARSIEYRRHEFGASHPEHTFSYWPGFSLNPALWDLRTLRAGMARMCSHHRGSCARKPPHSSDAAGSGTAWTSKHHGLYFDTGVQLFEQVRLAHQVVLCRYIAQINGSDFLHCLPPNSHYLLFVFSNVGFFFSGARRWLASGILTL